MNGKKRDDDKRIHKDLIAYSDLNSQEKKKDIKTIRITKGI